MQLHFSVTFACCGNVEILVSTWCEAEVVRILKMILGKNYWCADSPGLQVYKSASLQVCKSASLQVCSLQVCKSAVCKCRTPIVAHRNRCVQNAECRLHTGGVGLSFLDWLIFLHSWSVANEDFLGVASVISRPATCQLQVSLLFFCRGGSRKFRKRGLRPPPSR